MPKINFFGIFYIKSFYISILIYIFITSNKLKSIVMKNLEVFVLTENKAKFDQEFYKLVKLAEKFEVATPIMKVGNKETRKVRFYDKDLGGYASHLSYFVEGFNIELEISETLKFNGWSLFATVHHREDVVDLVDIESKTPEHYGCSYVTCEHCNTTRNDRVRSFIVTNNQNEFKQVGSTCIDNFLGVSPSKLLKLSAQLTVCLSEAFTDDESDGGGLKRLGSNWIENRRAYDLKEIFYVADFILSQNNYEYVKKEYGFDGAVRYRTNEGKATVELMYDFMEKENYVAQKIEDDRFEGFMEFVKNMQVEHPKFDEEMSFTEQIHELEDATMVRKMDFWKVVWIILLKKREDEAKLKENKHIGVVGEKSVVKCVIKDYKSGEGVYGMWELYLMEDEKGNQINKFGTINSKFLIKGEGNKNDFAEIGDTVFANAMIKSHDSKGAVNITMLGRLSKAK